MDVLDERISRRTVWRGWIADKAISVYISKAELTGAIIWEWHSPHDANPIPVTVTQKSIMNWLVLADQHASLERS
jgi:hypothetical protein